MHGSARTSVALLALPESSASVLYGLYDVLRSVGEAWTTLTGQAPEHGGFSVSIVAADSAAFACDGGVPVAPHASFDASSRYDVAIVSDLVIPEAGGLPEHWTPAAAWLREQYAADATLCSVCTGSALLAQTGLLDGREATTHWGARRVFDTCFPRVVLEPDRILVAAGEDHRLITTGGGATWEELALYLTRRYCGEAAAVRTAKVFLLGDRSEGQRPYMALAPLRRTGDAAIDASLDWIAKNFAAPSPVTGMAQHSGLAERTFKRRFRAVTGQAPLSCVQALRIEEAKRLLETSDLPTEDVGFRVGYEDPASFRRLFRKLVGSTPARYRKRFRRIGMVEPK